mmetsp:Transcript_26504/g.99706  ORF Transcript_26504/g.99706 Transcript_26504/m.99706 type:complete len:409 (+) Transcript_26504:342-1568(+)
MRRPLAPMGPARPRPAAARKPGEPCHHEHDGSPPHSPAGQAHEPAHLAVAASALPFPRIGVADDHGGALGAHGRFSDAAPRCRGWHSLRDVRHWPLDPAGGGQAAGNGAICSCNLAGSAPDRRRVGKALHLRRHLSAVRRPRRRGRRRRRGRPGAGRLGVEQGCQGVVARGGGELAHGLGGVFARLLDGGPHGIHDVPKERAERLDGAGVAVAHPRGLGRVGGVRCRGELLLRGPRAEALVEDAFLGPAAALEGVGERLCRVGGGSGQDHLRGQADRGGGGARLSRLSGQGRRDAGLALREGGPVRADAAGRRDLLFEGEAALGAPSHTAPGLTHAAKGVRDAVFAAGAAELVVEVLGAACDGRGGRDEGVELLHGGGAARLRVVVAVQADGWVARLVVLLHALARLG